MATREPRLNEAFSKAFRVCLHVVSHEWRGFLPMCSQAALGMYLVLFLGQGGGAMTLLTGLVYCAALVGLLAWCMRASLSTLHPEAEGTQVTLDRYVWRMGLAWATTILPAVLVASVLFSTGDPASALYMGTTILAVVAIFVGFMMAVLTSAQVTATGDWNPLAAWKALKGGRVVAVQAVTVTVLGTMAVMPVFSAFYIIGGIESPLGAVVSFPSFMLLHGALALGLGAMGMALHDTLTTTRPA